MSWQANTVLEDPEALTKTHSNLNAQTAHNTTGPTIPADAQHKAKHVSSVKRTTLQAHPHVKGERHKSTRGQQHPPPPPTYSYDNQPVSHVEVVEIGQITNPGNKISLHINNNEFQLYVDSGCKKTIIPQTQYTESLGQIRPSKTRFRQYGTQEHLTTFGEVPVSLRSSNGAQDSTTIYVVQGHKIAPLLGDEDAKALGILTINKGGHTPQIPDTTSPTDIASITANIQAAGIQIKSEKEPDESIPVDERTRVQTIIDKHPSAFSGIGLLKDEEVGFHIDWTVPPVASPYQPGPLAYREILSAHLQSLREENKIEDVDPNDHCPWISNVVITKD